jgi:hypothetical protein
VKRALASIFALLCIAVAAAVSPQVERTSAPEPEVVFGAFDVFVDTGSEPLAAYQVELKDVLGRARIVGIEGGAPQPFRDPPHYDPRAMRNDHVILGAFSTAADLPRGKVRVARLHIMSEGGPPDFRLVLTTAGAPGGRKLNASATLEPTAQGDGK